jgi:cytochrome b pre-mRNA-processing protein 3
MIFGHFRKKPHRELVERLHEKIVAQSRLPAFFLPPYGAPDTLVGRFEILALNAGLALTRLSQAPQPGPEVAQALADAIFSHFDDALREIGISDVGVPKKMNKLAGAFMGRGAAYAQAFEQGEADQSGKELAAALARNVLGGAGDGAALAAYARAAHKRLADTPLDVLLKGEVFFPQP